MPHPRLRVIGQDSLGRQWLGCMVYEESRPSWADCQAALTVTALKTAFVRPWAKALWSRAHFMPTAILQNRLQN